MIVKEIQVMAKKMGLKVTKLKKAQLIHLIQKEEGNIECYATSKVTTCGQDDCLWRSDCLVANK